jgi:NodT family efflux transporter outer membrane factor (OMF) lipoprotein
LAAVGAAVLLAGCAAGPDYRTPPFAELKVPEQFTAAAPATSAEADLVRWWQAFGDPTLTALVERGLAANLDIDEAGSRVRAARADLRAARGALSPSLGAFGSGSRQVGERASSATGGRTNYQIGFDAAYEADLFGGGRRSVEAARATAEGTRASLRATQLTVASEIALNYLDAREAQARLRIARDTLSTLDETVEITGWRLQAGLVGSLDLEQARQLRAQTAAGVPAIETTYAAAANRLAVLLGEAPGAVNSLLEPAAEPPTAPAVLPAAIPGDVVRRRPDVALAERTLAAETARIGVQAAQLYPALTLSGTFSGSGGSLSNAAGDMAGSLVAGISAPIFRGGQIRAAVEAQRASAAGALAAYRTSVLTALEETENALVSVSATERRMQALVDAESAARSAAEIARIQYRSGRTDFQSLLDSERTLLSSQDSLASARVARATAAVQLYKALGGGWQAAPEPSSVVAP